MFDDQLGGIPAEPPRPVTLLPGLKLRSARSSRALLIPVVFVGFFALMPPVIAVHDPETRLALGRSETANGTVVRVRERDARQGGGLEVIYAFRPGDGPEYRASRSVRPGSPYVHVRAGDSVPVRFLASDPSVSVIAGEVEADAGFFFIFPIFPLFAIFVFAPFLLPRLIQVLRDRRVFGKGRVVTGTVLFVKPGGVLAWPGWPGWGGSEVFVGFRLSSGAPA